MSGFEILGGKEAKFKRLAEYFGELSEEDICSLDPEDMVECAEPKDKLIMRVFANKVHENTKNTAPEVGSW